jgi:hypothetical protein
MLTVVNAILLIPQELIESLVRVVLGEFEDLFAI